MGRDEQLQLALASAKLDDSVGNDGSTDPRVDGTLRGDHYDMMLRRLVFEQVHKSVGYFFLANAALTLLTVMWDSNAPSWMWIGLFLWWICFVAASLMLQRKGRAVDTYQAIWGCDPVHPRNIMSA